MGRFIKVGATNCVLLNTSDLRAVLMTARAVMEVAWGGVPAGGDTGNYKDWGLREYRVKASAMMAKLYQDYFGAIPKTATGNDYGDQIYHSEARQMLMSQMITGPYYSIPGQSPKWTAVRLIGVPLSGANPNLPMGPHYAIATATRELKVTGDAQSKWDAVWREALAGEAAVPADRKLYYDYAIITNIAMNRDGNHILYLLSHAVLAAQKGDKSAARRDALATMADFAEIKKLEKQAEYDKWKNWYRGEWLDGVDETHKMVQDYIAWLDDPLKVPQPTIVNSWQGYYHIMHYEGTKQTDVN